MPAEIGGGTGLPQAKATPLLSRRQWREGDVSALQTVAARHELELLLAGLSLLVAPGREA